jgi:hypothetical protein
VSTQAMFNGGWLDLRALLRVLGGRPFQAEFEEVFTPSSGGAPQRRSGRVLVDSRRRVRIDVLQEGQPAIMFLHDAPRGRMLCGVVDQPETWVRSQWATVLDPVDASPLAAPPFAPALCVESVVAEGTHECRVYGERHDEPDESLFPEV